MRKLKKKFTLKDWVVELYKRTLVHDSTGMAAQLAYFFLLSVFPLLIFLFALIPFFPLNESDVLNIIRDFAPKDTMDLIDNNVASFVNQHNGKILSFGLIGTLWSASIGMNGIIIAINRAYNVKEDRPFYKTRGLSIILTVALIFVVFIALLLIIFGRHLGIVLFAKIGLSDEFISIWETLRMIVSISILFIVFTCIYFFAPNKQIKCIDVFPGATVATLGWVVTSVAFSHYVSNFGKFSVTYGSIGGVIVLMIWLYLSGFMLIIGGEINAINVHRKDENC